MAGVTAEALRARGISASIKNLPDVMNRLGWEREQFGPKNARRRGFAKTVSSSQDRAGEQ